MQTFETFVVSDTSAEAWSAAVAFAEGRATTPLVIFGPVGCGKTHLLQAIAHRMDGRRLQSLSAHELSARLMTAIRERAAEQFPSTFDDLDALLIDDFRLPPHTQQMILRLLEALAIPIVIAADAPLPIANATTVHLGYPTRPARLELARRIAAAHGLDLPANVLNCLAERHSRSPRELQSATSRISARISLVS